MEYKLKLINEKVGLPFTQDGITKYLHPNTFTGIVAPLDKAGNHITGLNKEREKYYEVALNKPSGYFSPRSKFWSGGEVFGEERLPFMYKYIANVDSKSGKDLGAIVDVDNKEGQEAIWKELTIEFLKGNPYVRKFGDVWRTYQLVELISVEEEISNKAKKVSSKALAYKLFGETEDEELKEIYLLINPSAKGANIDLVKSRLGDLVDSKPEAFIAVINDPKRKEKSRLTKAVKENIITISGDEFYFGKNFLGKNLDEVLNFLASPKNSKIKLEILQLLEDGYKELASGN